MQPRVKLRRVLPGGVPSFEAVVKKLDAETGTNRCELSFYVDRVGETAGEIRHHNSTGWGSSIFSPSIEGEKYEEVRSRARKIVRRCWRFSAHAYAVTR
jgi:hypothetical protein